MGPVNLILLGFVLLVAALLLCLHVATILALRFEKQPVRTFRPLPPGPPPQLLPYIQAMSRQAAEQGFIPHGAYAHTKGGTYRVHACLWLSPSREILALVGGGTIGRMPYKRTLLYSRLGDETILVTTDLFGVDDISGLLDIKFLVHAGFAELLQFHEGRLTGTGKKVMAFTGGMLIEEVAVIRADCARRLVERGDAVFVDSARSVWRYTLKGALRYYFKTQGKHMREASAQRKRMRLARPGEGGAA